MEILNIKPKIKKKKIILDLDLTKGIYKKKDLKEEEIIYLLKNGYEESRHITLHDSHGSPSFLVKKIHNHTSEHTFLVYTIFNEILNPHQVVKWGRRDGRGRGREEGEGEGKGGRVQI